MHRHSADCVIRALTEPGAASGRRLGADRRAHSQDSPSLVPRIGSQPGRQRVNPGHARVENDGFVLTLVSVHVDHHCWLPDSTPASPTMSRCLPKSRNSEAIRVICLGSA
jgi:hypothetical protein